MAKSTKCRDTRRQARKDARGISRGLILQLVDDLRGRLVQQSYIAEAISRTAESKGDMVNAAAWPLQVISIAADKHAEELRRATGLAKMIAERIAPGRPAAKIGGAS